MFISCSEQQTKLKYINYNNSELGITLQVPDGLSIEKKQGFQGSTPYNAVNLFDSGTSIWIIVGEISERETLNDSTHNKNIDDAKMILQSQFGANFERPWEKKIIINGIEGWAFGAYITSKKIIFKSVNFESIDKTFILSLTTKSSIKSDSLWSKLITTFKFDK
jgi:hypothetical protein